MKVSIILPCFKRIDYLNYTLWSLSQQEIYYDLELLVLNDYIDDGKAESVCNKYKDRLNIKYIFTGQRNSYQNIIKRDQGFVLNIGIKQAKGEIVILTGNGLFHLNNTVNLIVGQLIGNEKIMSVPRKINFDDGKIVDYLSKHISLEIPEEFEFIFKTTSRSLYAGTLPYWFGVYRKELIDIGGHDEDMTGFGGLDDDLIGRLRLKGLTFSRCDAKIVHLYHPVSMNPVLNKWEQPEWVYNNFLRLKRKNQIIRNENKEWGKL